MEKTFCTQLDTKLLSDLHRIRKLEGKYLRQIIAEAIAEHIIIVETRRRKTNE